MVSQKVKTRKIVRHPAKMIAARGLSGSDAHAIVSKARKENPKLDDDAAFVALAGILGESAKAEATSGVPGGCFEGLMGGDDVKEIDDYSDEF